MQNHVLHKVEGVCMLLFLCMLTQNRKSDLPFSGPLLAETGSGTPRVEVRGKRQRRKDLDKGHH